MPISAYYYLLSDRERCLEAGFLQPRLRLTRLGVRCNPSSRHGSRARRQRVRGRLAKNSCQVPIRSAFAAGDPVPVRMVPLTAMLAVVKEDR
jgi:hypothetical protein